MLAVKKSTEQEARDLELRVMVCLAEETKDFGPGLHYPTLKDTFLYTLIFGLPVLAFSKLTGKGKNNDKEA